MKKQDNHEDNMPTEPLADLPLSGERAEETAGGSFLAYDRFHGGVFVGAAIDR